MSPSPTIQTVSAPASPIELVSVADEHGRAFFIPKATFEFFIQQGLTSAVVTLSFLSKPARKWLTLADAAKLVQTDIDGIEFDAARMKVRRACDSGAVIVSGSGRDRRIDPVSLDAWRLAQREANLDEDTGH